MPLIEIATVRLQPSFSSNPPEAFTSAWTHACQLATKAADGVAFQLYHATPPTDKDLYYLIGGWKSGEDHIAFLTTPDAVTLAKSIGAYMTVDVVRHIDGDIGALNLGDSGERPKRLRVRVYKVSQSDVTDWESRWNKDHYIVDGAGGWDLSTVVQKQHKAFRQMGEATNSVSAFGGGDDSSSRTWVWVDSGETDTGSVLTSGKVEVETFGMEHTLG